MTIQLAGLNGGTVDIAADALQSFKAAFKGPLLTADDPAYEDTRKVWNAMIDRRPGLIARCTGTADVVQAVRFARQHGLLISVRGGGHNIAGLAVCEGGLMIDLSLMRGRVGRSGTAAHGTRAGRLHARRRRPRDPAARPGRRARLRLGHRDRRPDGRRRLRLPDATPRLDLRQPGLDGGRHCRRRKVAARRRRTRTPSLFWALRGGSGNFGIVTSFEYRLFPVGPEILGGAIAWRARGRAGRCSTLSANSAPKAPRELTTCVAVLRIAPPAPWLPKEMHGKPIVALFVCHSGSIEDGEKLARALARASVDRWPTS